MTILEQLSAYREAKQEALLMLALHASKIKPDFVSSIKNKNTDLLERWELFRAANNDLKEHFPGRWTGGTGMRFIMQNWPQYVDLYPRGTKIIPLDLFDDIFWQGKWNEQDYGQDKTLYLMAMEEILQQNVGSFIW